MDSDDDDINPIARHKANAVEDQVSDQFGFDSKRKRHEEVQRINEMDSIFEFGMVKDTQVRPAWLLNMHPGELLNDEDQLLSAVHYYFIGEDGGRFKVCLPFKPYFYLATKENCEKEVCLYLTKKYSGELFSVEVVPKEDLSVPNHLIGLRRNYLKLIFINVTNMTKVRHDLMPKIRKNREKEKSKSTYTEMLTSHFGGQQASAQMDKTLNDQVDNIVDIREHDVPYHVRVSIDLKIFVGQWYDVIGRGSDDKPHVTKNADLIDRPDPIVLAFDIETTKEVLKFPDAQHDKIIMISYMIDGQGFLIVNREIVSQDVDDFSYTPKPEYPGPFIVYNEADECQTLVRFFDHILEVKPHIFVTYNGDFFDWPFIETRAAVYGLHMGKKIGFTKDSQGEYKSSQCIHMDAFRWVRRDSYLPMGSQGLKACTKAKLRYDPQELDPELMVQMAREQPKVLASYSVSDAVATYYLYMKYVHPFIFALCTIIPMEPDEVLRKGSGTLCEALLMVEAFQCNIIFPNKQESELRKTAEDGRLIDSETYVGGHVEALESGVFRTDLPCRFRLDSEVIKQLIDELDRTMTYSIRMEGVEPAQVLDFDQKCEEVRQSLQNLADCPNRLENPIIYHLDVGAMYPNIILTNRLQPQAIIDDTVCAACDFNKPNAKCQRKMEWMWRAEVAPANRSEYQRILQQLENETFVFNNSSRAFHQLPKDEQIKIEKKRLQDYCRKAYKRLHETRSELRQVTVCQRENPFYVDTVKAFRDRRYEYKAMLKTFKKKLDAALKTGDALEVKSCKSKEILYDSLQLAHKCILNSFYGYVMRRGSRWFSMEMAGIVCYTGAQIITKAKELIDKIGRPLELDTDGIWCILPASFPENLTFTTSNPKRPILTISYPGAALNILIRDSYTNDQYHTLTDEKKKNYKVSSENSIAFEVDGPYRAMILPASKEEGKKLKKRYAVFNFDGSLAELKGFEVKRRGELQLIKNFQSSIFDAFLKGSTLDEVYENVASVADYWLDVLFSKASCVSDKELFDLLSENRNLSRKLEDYGNQKSTSITVAKRLAEFLGDEMVKDAGLNCKIIIASKPQGTPVTERAIPAVIFQAEESVKRHYLRKWTKCTNMENFDIREILEWPYYIERLGSAIQKIITIPAALQGIPNPVPRVPHPEWLHKRLLEKTDIMKQRRITDLFKKTDKNDVTSIESSNNVDIEEIRPHANETLQRSKKQPLVVTRKVRPTQKSKFVDSFREENVNLGKTWREVLGDPPNFGTNKQQRLEWLEFLKKKWSFQRGQRDHFKKLRKRPADAQGFMDEATAKHVRSSTGSHFTAAVGLDAFVQRSVRSLFELPWKIVQFVQSSEPGLFYLWIFVSNELRKVKLRVPRVFYINSKVAKEKDSSEAYTKVQRVLPRSNQVHNLYRYSVPEEKFQQHVNDLLVESSAPDIEGVYETQVPLTFRLLVNLGCVCRLVESRRIRAYENETFCMDDLEFLSLVHCQYLETDGYRQAFIYNYAQLKSSLRETLLPEDNFHFEVQTCPSAREAHRCVQRCVREYKDEKTGPTLIAFISKYESESLIKLMPSLSDFPLIKLRINQPDTIFSTLDWQRVGCRYMINYFLNYPNYFQTYLELSRYLHIPVGNVPSDFAQFGADIFFARHLQRQNCVLWASPTERPDLGGKEADNNRLSADFTEYHDLKFNEPGFYTNYCVEFEVASMPVAAILQSHKISEMEGVNAAVGFDSGQAQYGIDEMVTSNRNAAANCVGLASYDETALCAHSFRILKNVVHSWVRDVANFSNKFADNQIVHFYRWLRSSSSFLYEPALKKILNGLMKKLFLLLVSEMKRLNVNVIFADSSKIVICTKKRSYADALSYAQFILESLSKKDLFSPLDITVSQAWRLILWLDTANFGGIKYGNSRISSETDDAMDQMLNDDEIVVDMNWNMVHFLPEMAECQANFNTLIAGYILMIYRFLLDRSKIELSQNAIETSFSSLHNQSLLEKSFSTTQTIFKNEKFNDQLANFCQQLVGGEMTQKLLAVVQKIQRKIMVSAGETGVMGMFPNLPGSHTKLTNPALEFAKSVCKVLGLDTNLVNETENLKRTLLKCLAVGEFSDDAQWTNPCLSYVLPELICKFCGHCRDVDLCRDPYIYEQPEEIGKWRCQRCSKEYDQSEIEAILLQHVNNWMMSYCLQDLKCLKCKMIKLGNLNKLCECTGEFGRVMCFDDVEKTFKVFSNLAKCYKMEYLSEALQQIHQPT